MSNTTATPDLSWLKNGYRITDLKPRFPKNGATLEDVIPNMDQGITWGWEAWREYFEGEAIRTYDPKVGVSDEIRMQWGALSLDLDILKATHKKLFGVVTEKPTELAVRLIAYALFDPYWISDLYANAEANQKRKRELEAALTDLLSALEE